MKRSQPRRRMLPVVLVTAIAAMLAPASMLFGQGGVTSSRGIAGSVAGSANAAGRTGSRGGVYSPGGIAGGIANPSARAASPYGGRSPRAFDGYSRGWSPQVQTSRMNPGVPTVNRQGTFSGRSAGGYYGVTRGGYGRPAGRVSAYYDLGVPVQDPTGIAGGIANGQLGGIAGDIANGPIPGVVGGQFGAGSSLGGDIGRPNGLDFSVYYPPVERRATNFTGPVGTSDFSVATRPASGGLANPRLGGNQPANFSATVSGAASSPPIGSGQLSRGVSAGVPRHSGESSNPPVRSRLQERFGDDF